MNRLTTFLLCAAVCVPALTAQTGQAVPELAALDRDIPALMASAHVPGGAVAIVKDGRLVFARGYGLADTGKGEAFQPDSLCRVGSVSKTITATAILKLWENGLLNLDDRVFAGILTQFQPLPGATPDSRLWNITVRQLLHHTGGHGRDTGVDPLNVGSAKAACAGPFRRATTPLSATPWGCPSISTPASNSATPTTASPCSLASSRRPPDGPTKRS